MCLALFAESDNHPMELTFAFERIFQRRSGATEITVDLLVKNNSETERVKRIHVVMPHALVDFTTTLSECSTDGAAEAALSLLRDEELNNIELNTIQFADQTDFTHWPYNTCVPHLGINKALSNGGLFAVQRTNRADAKGAIKRGWRKTRPQWVDQYVWLLLVANEIAIFDIELSADANENIEALQPHEEMWIRLKIQVPARGFNKKSWFQLNISRFVDYHECFSSSAAAVDLIASRMPFFNNFAVSFRKHSPKIPFICAQLHHAADKIRSSGVLPPLVRRLREIDWRAFLYREHGVNVVAMDFPIATPARPTRAPTCNLPLSAFPHDAKFGFWHPCFNGFASLFIETRTATCDEMWIGASHDRDHANGYVVRINTRRENNVYHIFAWLGFLGFLMGLVNFLKGFGWLKL